MSMEGRQWLELLAWPTNTTSSAGRVNAHRNIRGPSERVHPNDDGQPYVIRPLNTYHIQYHVTNGQGLALVGSPVRLAKSIQSPALSRVRQSLPTRGEICMGRNVLVKL
jgi:hypothetical protein